MSQSTVFEHTLAGRGERLVSSISDTIFAFFAVFPGYLLGGLTAEYSSLAFIVLLGGFLLFMGIQIFFLVRDGQTLGKKAFGIKIVDATSGKPANWAALIFQRGLLSGVLSVIPYIGRLYIFADVLFIFRADRRCIHDHLAGTVVVNA